MSTDSKVPANAALQSLDQEFAAARKVWEDELHRERENTRQLLKEISLKVAHYVSSAKLSKDLVANKEQCTTLLKERDELKASQARDTDHDLTEESTKDSQKQDEAYMSCLSTRMSGFKT